MTIIHTYTHDGEDGVKLIVDRDYENSTVTLTIDRYSDTLEITLPVKEMFTLMRHAGVVF